MPTVDSLDIQISAQAVNAEKSLDGLVAKLNTLSSSLGKINNQSIGKFASNLTEIANRNYGFRKTTNTLVSGLNGTTKASTSTTKSVTSLAAAFGKFYANYFLLVRGAKSLWSSIEGTADYIEAYNYFNVALGKIGSDWEHQWEQYGYENGEAYAESFATRLSDSLKNLSGVTVEIGANGNGLLTATNMKSLGMNIQEITQYASQLASVTNSVGQTGEVSLAAADAFTKLGADISSLFNLDYSGVMGNLQSGLIGQSRALYKYGIDITNATLQTYAYELGLEKAVSEMTQAEKMQLRMIAILDQSKVSWGDLANTINSPSNMIRQFTNNLKESGLILGQLFVPVLQKVLPLINGITIAFKNLLVSFAGFFGIQIDLSSFGQGYSDLEDDVDGVTDSFDDATASAKALKTATLGIDELNINAPQDTSSTVSDVSNGIDLTSEILSATEEYQRAWSEAFANMESKAQKFAEKFDKIFAPIKNMAFHFSIGDFETAGNDLSNLAIGIFDGLTNTLEQQDWSEVGKKIGQFLDGIDWSEIFKSGNNFFKTLVESAVEAWKSSAEEAPLETVILTALGLSATSPAGMALLGKVGTAYITFVVSTEITKGVMTWLFPKDKEWYINFKFIGDDEYSLSHVVEESIQDGTWKTALGYWREDILQWLHDTFGSWASFTFEDLSIWWNDSVAPWFSREKWMTMAAEGIIGITDSWFNFTMGYRKDISDWWDNDVSPWFTKEKWKAIFENVRKSFKEKWNDIVYWWNNSAINVWWNDDVSPWFTKEKWGNTFDNIRTSLSDKWGEIALQWRNFINSWWEDDVKVWFTKEKWKFEGIKDGLSTAWELAIESVKQIWNRFANWLNEKLTWEIEPIVIMGKTIFEGTTISLGKIPTFQTGGFPEDGLFFANHHEFVGRFSNGKTAVANNGMIVEGIEGGVERAVARVLAPYLADIAQNTRETADKDFNVNIGDRDIARANARGQKSLGYQLITV